MQLPIAFYFTDDARGSCPLEISKTLPPNTGVIFRHYNAPHRISLARKLAKICRKNGTPLFVAKTPGLAASISATGCHLPENFIAMVPAIRRRFPQLYISAACHSETAVIAARQMGVDLAFLSPVFATKSHPGAKYLGILHAAQIAHATRLPIYALGGITPNHFNAVRSAGFTGFGAIGLFED